MNLLIDGIMTKSCLLFLNPYVIELNDTDVEKISYPHLQTDRSVSRFPRLITWYKQPFIGGSLLSLKIEN